MPEQEHIAESEVQKTEEATRQGNKQVRRTQEDKERARQIDNIIHSVVQSVSASLFHTTTCYHLPRFC